MNYLNKLYENIPEISVNKWVYYVPYIAMYKLTH